MSEKPNEVSFVNASCPLPLQHNEQIILGHGSGGKLTQKLIQDHFYPFLASTPLSESNDFARVSLHDIANLDGQLAISTDAHVITPLFFPGGDIGRLAICGTVNDVAMSGGIPLYLTASFIIEEGLPIETLDRVLQSMCKAAHEANVSVVAGDTKVVAKGQADGLFITTTGVGWIPAGMNITGSMAKPGDAILISGTLGDHGVAVLTARGELGIETQIVSDQAPLNGLIRELLAAAPDVHVLRDPTRGGLATTLNEIATQSNVGMVLDEAVIPVSTAVASVCELLGFDPLYVANEGKVIVIVPESQSDIALQAMRRHHYGVNAARIGSVTEKNPKKVLLKTGFGSTRILDILSGEMLPRIC